MQPHPIIPLHTLSVINADTIRYAPPNPNINTIVASMFCFITYPPHAFLYLTNIPDMLSHLETLRLPHLLAPTHRNMNKTPFQFPANLRPPLGRSDTIPSHK